MGVMGRGLGIQFRNEFPENYEAYRTACHQGEVQFRKMLVSILDRQENPRYVINFPTKRHWKDKSRIGDIRAGLKSLADEIRHHGIASVAVPPLGCGLGGLEWKQVRPLIEDAFGATPDVRVLVYEPGPILKHQVETQSTRKYLGGYLVPTHNIIDNRNEKLCDHINRILGSTEAARFAVGYFFVSGLTCIADKLAGLKELRLLIGNTTDRQTLEQLAEGTRRLELVADKLESQRFRKRTEAKQAADKTAEKCRRRPGDDGSDRRRRNGRQDPRATNRGKAVKGPGLH